MQAEGGVSAGTEIYTNFTRDLSDDWHGLFLSLCFVFDVGGGVCLLNSLLVLF